MGWVYLIIALVALGGGYGVVRTYNSAIEKAQEAEADAKEARRKQASLQSMLDDADELAKREKQQRAAAQAATRRLKQELTDARKDPETAKWLDTPIPTAYRELRGARDKRAGVPDSNSTPRSDPSTAEGLLDKRRTGR